MPHQCLKCGVLFPEGSTVILRGCPDCRGTRFFYTQSALAPEERAKLLRTSEMGLREAIDQLVKEAKDGTLKPEVADWLKIEPTDGAPAAAPDGRSRPPAEEEPEPARETPPGQARVLPGNKLLITVPKTLRARRRAPERALRWDYEAPTPAPVPAPEPRSVEFVPPPAPPADAPIPQIQDAPVAPAREAPAPSVGERPETIHISKPGEYEIDVKRLLEEEPIVIQRDGSYLIHLPSLFQGGPRDRRGRR